MNALRFTLPMLLLAACQKAEPPPAQPKAELDHRALALASPGGETSVDALVRERQTAVVKNTAKDDLWVLLGQAWVRKARASSDPGFYLNAKAAGRVALELTPEHGPAQNLLGLVYLNDHAFEDAKALAEKLHAKSPDDPMALGTLADALVELGDYDGAARAVDKMMRLKPNLPSYGRAAYLAWLRGELAEAKQAIRLAFDAGRGQRDREPAAWTLVEAAMMFWNEGDHAGAKAGFELALSYLPDYPPALVGMGRVHLASEQPAEAARVLTAAFEASPLASTAWLLGDARHAAGDLEGARKAYAEVERIGRLGDARTLVAFLGAKDRDRELMLRLAEQEARKRRSIETLDGLALALHRAGRHEEAQKAIDEAMRLGTKDARLYFHAGLIQNARGKLAEGRALLEKALVTNPAFDYSGAAEARAALSGS